MMYVHGWGVALLLDLSVTESGSDTRCAAGEDAGGHARVLAAHGALQAATSSSLDCNFSSSFLFFNLSCDSRARLLAMLY